ncbi:MAG TPA: ABC transporter substrate-binding protein [Bradyrhizobium sp.]|jgi:putative ABC transport system substrate-binding protein|nr:ABC transporter substrate-binding protein [Bradyrhizobium sp.]
MRRREFIGLIGAAAVTLPAKAQQVKIPVIGLLSSSTEVAERPRRAAFVRRLGELGWPEGRGIMIEDRAAGGVAARAGEIAQEFVRLGVDVMVMAGDAQVLAARRTAPEAAIVFAAAGDPVGNGLVASLPRPGGKVTGLSVQLTDTAGKRVQLLHEIVPALRRLALIGNAANPVVALELDAAQSAAATLGLEAIRSEFRRGEDIPQTIEALRGRADGVYVCVDPLMIANRVTINTLALAARLPVVHSYRDNLEGGGLVSYGPDLLDLYRRTAGIVDKILRGTKPADIPVEQPTRFELAVDLRAARALGLTMPPALLARADEVIE